MIHYGKQSTLKICLCKDKTLGSYCVVKDTRFVGCTTTFGCLKFCLFFIQYLSHVLEI